MDTSVHMFFDVFRSWNGFAKATASILMNNQVCDMKITNLNEL